MIICCYKFILIFLDFIIGCVFFDFGVNEYFIFFSLLARKKIIVKFCFLGCILLGDVGNIYF